MLGKTKLTAKRKPWRILKFIFGAKNFFQSKDMAARISDNNSRTLSTCIKPGVPNLWYAYHWWYADAFLVVREMFFQNCKKSLCFHRNSHPKKCCNVNLAFVHFLLLLNCNTYTLNIYIQYMYDVAYCFVD